MKVTVEWEIRQEDKLTINANGKIAANLTWAFQKLLNNFEGHNWEEIIEVLKDLKPNNKKQSNP